MLNLKKTLLIANLLIFGNTNLVAGDNLFKPTLLMAGLLKTVHKLGEVDTPKIQPRLIFLTTPHINSPKDSKLKWRTKSRHDKKFAARRENFNTRYPRY
jgi:hypothetical protein